MADIISRVRLTCLAVLGAVLLGACVATPPAALPNGLLVDLDRVPDEIVSIWPNGPPGGIPPGLEEYTLNRDNPFDLPDHAAFDITDPTLTIFRAAKPNGSAVMIVPGGGYARVVIEKEGYEGARWFNRQGVTAYVLKYRLPHQGWAAGSDTPLQDAQRAMRVIRARAVRDGIDPNRIAVMGFSAGGHVAGSLLTRFEAATYSAIDDADQLSARPDIGALIYPVTVMDSDVAHEGSRLNLIGDAADLETQLAYSIDHQPPDNTPPTFLLHAADDKGVPADNAVRVYQAFQMANIPVALHVFDSGGHGFGFRGIDQSPLHVWPELFMDFAYFHGLALPEPKDEAGP